MSKRKRFEPMYDPVIFFSCRVRSAAEIGTISWIGTTPTSTVVPPRPVAASAQSGGGGGAWRRERRGRFGVGGMAAAGAGYALFWPAGGRRGYGKRGGDRRRPVQKGHTPHQLVMQPITWSPGVKSLTPGP